ncbi:tyrosine--tRNA ligase [Aeoliella sp. SH292]|uniref:tyrosine--tRNA ligase n=1 Tax=Aeoliella sp. SH292 TaxID=3454464 RepID=UPI003F9E23FC
MNLLDDLRWRNLVHQTTDDENLGAWLAAEPRTVYAGFDPTAESLHVGHLLPLLMLRRFQKAGHKPIALVGGATGMIGDPSGKSAERNLQSREALEANVAAIREQMQQFLDFGDGPHAAKLVNNLDWIGKFSYIDFLRDVGKNFPVNVMLAKDSIKGRIERDDAGISYTEFSYMLLQAFDFVHLNREYGCELQIGGSDQWGNITAGIDLARRMHSAHVRGMTAPLLLKSDGTKMGKTESGALWLAPDRTSPYQFFQYWMNVDDADAGNCLRVLTELPREEIEALDAQRATAPEKRESQKRLAEALTHLVHGDEGLKAANRATEIFFGAEISDLSDKELGSIFADVPSCELPRAALTAGMPVVDLLASTPLAKSKGEARRTIEQGGAYVNNRRVADVAAQVTDADLASETVMVLRSGRKKYALVRFV